MSGRAITDVDAVSLTVHGAPVEYDLLTGAVSGTQDVVFSGSCLSGETFNDGNYIGFGYLLTAGQTVLSADLLLNRDNVDYIYYLTNIPVRANYRTNLIGQF